MNRGDFFTHAVMFLCLRRDRTCSAEDRICSIMRHICRLQFSIELQRKPASHVAAAPATLSNGVLKQAKAEIDQVWSDAVDDADRPRLRGRRGPGDRPAGHAAGPREGRFL